MAYSRKKKISLIIFILIILLIIIILLLPRKIKGNPSGLIKINNKIIVAELVSEPRLQYQGLSNRESLCADCGMLFVFRDKRERDFVMRNMNFPLDILFITDNKIINIAENLTPEGNQPSNIYQSAQAVDQVLELNGGYCQKNGIKAGDLIKIN